MDYVKLSKELSYALRHAPWEYELELDEEGWVGLDQLLASFHLNETWRDLNARHIAAVADPPDAQASGKKRFELAEGRIRALYGHSVPQRIVKRPETPPDVLYHGTARAWLDLILAEGLKPMNRQYVHCSSEPKTAEIVGRRKDGHPVLLAIDAAAAARNGVAFYRGGSTIWLADPIPAAYLSADGFHLGAK